jgi:hypothetical protein
MQALDLYRYTGIAGIVAGIMNVIVELLPERIGLPLDMLINILGLWVLSALYLRQREVSGFFGLIAYTIQFIGITLVVGFLFTQAFVLLELDAAQRAAILAGPAGLAAILALGLMTIGAVLFGITTLRAGVFPKWAALLLMAGFIIVPIGAVGFELIKGIGELILSGGLISMSYALFSSAQYATSTQLASN